MGAIRAGGIVSGMDTNALIDKILENSKKPIKKIKDDSHLVQLQLSLFKEVNSDLTKLKDSSLNLRLQSTFNSKNITTSKKDIASATAGVNSKIGTYNLEVIRTAKNSSITSKYVSATYYKSGAGVTGLNLSRATNKYNQQEGTTKVDVLKGSKGEYVAQSFFTSNNENNYRAQLSTSNIASSLMNEYGEISNLNTKEVLQFNLNIPGRNPIGLKNITIDFSKHKVSDINQLNAIIEDALNDVINDELDTSMEQYVAVRSIYDTNSSTWKSAIYYTTDMDFTVSASGGNNITQSLGLESTMNITYETGIAKFVVGNTISNLENKLKEPESSIIYNMPLVFNNSSLEEGQFEIYQDSSVNVRKAKNTRIISKDLGLKGKDILNKKPSEIGLNGSLNGFISINGKRVKLENTENMTVNDIIGYINATNTSVTMTFNKETGRFAIESSNKDDGSVQDITLTSDNSSNFIDIFGLNVSDGAIKEMGSNNGNIDTSKTIDALGFKELSGVFTINDVPIYVDSQKDTIDDVIRKVNSSSADVKLSYDAKADKFTLTSNTPKRIKLGSANDTSKILYVFGLTYNSSQPLTLGTKGNKAEAILNGVTHYSNTNTFENIANDMTVTVYSKGITTIDLAVDTNKAVDTLALFIKEYNTLVRKLRPEPISQIDRKEKMEALTEEKAKGMSQDDIKKYMEEYDKLHKNDIISKSGELSYLLRDLRANIMKPLINNNSSIKSFSDLGIDMAGAKSDVNLSRLGYLLKDSTDLEDIKNSLKDNSKLIDMLQTKPDDVYEFFGIYKDTATSENTANTPSTYIESWAKRYEDMLNKFQNNTGIIGNKISSKGPLEKRVESMDKEISRITSLTEKELNRLWQEFTFMEQRIGKIKQQTEYIDKLSNNKAK